MNFGNFFKTRMADKKIADAFRGATHFHMDDTDRAQIRERLRAYTALKPIRSGVRRAPRTNHSLFSFAFHPAPILALGLIFTVGVGSVSAAESALPGDILYPIKVGVNEEVREALARTPESRARIAIERAERRIQELKQLELTGATETIFAEAEARLDEHVHDAEEKTLAANGASHMTRERELVAILRTQESRLAVAETGGLSETDMASDAEFAAMTVAPPAQDVEAVVMTETVFAPAEDTLRMSAETPREVATHIPEQVFETRVAERAHETITPQVSNEKDGRTEKNIKRQERIARDRVESLKKLIEKMEKRGEDVHVARRGLQAAEDALRSADGARENNPAHASVLYAIATKTAIDVREQLADETAQNEDRKKDESSGKGDGKSGKKSNETREKDDD